MSPFRVSRTKQYTRLLRFVFQLSILRFFSSRSSSSSSSSSVVVSSIAWNTNCNPYHPCLDSPITKRRTNRNQVSVMVSMASQPTGQVISKKEENIHQRTPLHETTNPKNTTTCKWITCSSSKELSHAISTFVRPNDIVAELGSQLRDVSTSICESLSTNQQKEEESRRGKAILVDVCRNFPLKNEQRTHAMRRKNDELDFYTPIANFIEIKQLDDWRRAFFPTQLPPSQQQQLLPTERQQEQLKYDIFVIDVNSIVGNDLEFTTVSIVKEFLELNGGSKSCRYILIKSLTLNQWSNRLQILPTVISSLSNNPSTNNDPDHQNKDQEGNEPSLHNQHTNKLSLTPTILSTHGVQEYRNTIPFVVQPGDAVLEVGCHFGTSTILLHKAATATSGTATHSAANGYCIGVDIGKKIIQQAQKRFPHIYFSIGDAFHIGQLLRIQQEYYRSTTNDRQEDAQTNKVGFDVIFIDVGGLSGSDGLLESLYLISSLMYSLEPRCIVIKSLCMRRFSTSLIPYWKISQEMKRKQTKDDNNRNDGNDDDDE